MTIKDFLKGQLKTAGATMSFKDKTFDKGHYCIECFEKNDETSRATAIDTGKWRCEKGYLKIDPRVQ